MPYFCAICLRRLELPTDERHDFDATADLFDGIEMFLTEGAGAGKDDFHRCETNGDE